jgi:hypothetical protein
LSASIAASTPNFLASMLNSSLSLPKVVTSNVSEPLVPKTSLSLPSGTLLKGTISTIKGDCLDLLQGTPGGYGFKIGFKGAGYIFIPGYFLIYSSNFVVTAGAYLPAKLPVSPSPGGCSVGCDEGEPLGVAAVFVPGGGTSMSTLLSPGGEGFEVFEVFEGSLSSISSLSISR